MDKVIQGLYIAGTTTGAPAYSQPVALGSANAAMIEGWLTAATGSPTVTVTLQGSNDQANWDGLLNPTGPAAVSFSLGTAAPDYDKNAWNQVVPYAFVRLAITSSAAGAFSAMVDASIRTYTI